MRAGGTYDLKCGLRCGCDCRKDEEGGGDADVNGEENTETCGDCCEFEFPGPTLLGIQYTANVWLYQSHV